MSHVLAWSIAIGLVLFFGSVGYIIFPYVTPFVLIEDQGEHEHTSV